MFPKNKQTAFLFYHFLFFFSFFFTFSSAQAKLRRTTFLHPHRSAQAEQSALLRQSLTALHRQGLGVSHRILLRNAERRSLGLGIAKRTLSVRLGRALFAEAEPPARVRGRSPQPRRSKMRRGEAKRTVSRWWKAER